MNGMINLRKIEPSDLPFLYQWENDATSWAEGDTHNPLSQQDLRDYIASTTGDIFRDGQLRLIIEKKPTANSQEPTATLGCIDLFDLDPRNRKAALGMYITPEHRHRGFAAEALRQIEQYAFSFLHLRLLYAVIAISNISCSNLFRKAGYTPSSPLTGWTIESDAVIWIKQTP
ncbi:MAG: GNAT family N-acetyltransferase [Paludibacteraceae bacterium]|nr:GNAT family N-acetyltransferase [Paludibacteraceae bacterium]